VRSGVTEPPKPPKPLVPSSAETDALLSEASVQRVALRLAEAHLLMSEGRHEASLVESRKLGELVAKALLERSERRRLHSGAQSEAQGQLSLQRSAHLLERRGELPPPVAAALIALQPYGNVGAHDQGDDAAHISSASAQAACSSCVAITAWLWREERYPPELLSAPALLSEERQARWAQRFQSELSPLLSSQTRSRAAVTSPRGALIGLSLALLLASVTLALSLSREEREERPSAQSAQAGQRSSAELHPTQVTLKLDPERSLFELGDSAELRLIDAHGEPLPIKRVAQSGAQFQLSGARLRAVSSGRAELEVCAAGGACASRSLMVLLP